LSPKGSEGVVRNVKKGGGLKELPPWEHAWGSDGGMRTGCPRKGLGGGRSHDEGQFLSEIKSQEREEKKKKIGGKKSRNVSGVPSPLPPGALFLYQELQSASSE